FTVRPLSSKTLSLDGRGKGEGDLQRQLVKALSVAVQQRGLVVVGNFVALHQLAEIVLTTLVGDLVRKVGGVKERLIAHDLDRERHGQLFRLDADEAAAFFDLLLDVSARVLPLPPTRISPRAVIERSCLG